MVWKEVDNIERKDEGESVQVEIGEASRSRRQELLEKIYARVNLLPTLGLVHD